MDNSFQKSHFFYYTLEINMPTEGKEIDLHGHCLICYKMSMLPHQAETPEASQSSFEGRELCSQFLKLVTRHLGIKPNLEVSDTLNENSPKEKVAWENFVTGNVCQTCHDLIKPYCDLYLARERIKMQLQGKLLEIGQAIYFAEVDCESKAAKRRLGLTWDAANKNSTHMFRLTDILRDQIQEGVSKKQEQPLVSLNRADLHDSELNKNREGLEGAPHNTSPSSRAGCSATTYSGIEDRMSNQDESGHANLTNAQRPCHAKPQVALRTVFKCKTCSKKCFNRDSYREHYKSHLDRNKDTESTAQKSSTPIINDNTERNADTNPVSQSQNRVKKKFIMCCRERFLSSNSLKEHVKKCHSSPSTSQAPSSKTAEPLEIDGEKNQSTSSESQGKVSSEDTSSSRKSSDESSDITTQPNSGNLAQNTDETTKGVTNTDKAEAEPGSSIDSQKIEKPIKSGGIVIGFKLMVAKPESASRIEKLPSPASTGTTAVHTKVDNQHELNQLPKLSKYVNSSESSGRKNASINKVGQVSPARPGIKKRKRQRECKNWFKCELGKCTKRFTRLESLQLHKQFHLPHSCHFCGVMCQGPQKLALHEFKAHGGGHVLKGPDYFRGGHVKCPRCPESAGEIFHHINQYKTHFFSAHLGVKVAAMKCPYCNCVFMSLHGRAKHLKTYHGSETSIPTTASSSNSNEQFQCNLCGKAFFPTVAKLQEHMREEHDSNLLPCPDCPRSFSSQHVLSVHMKTFHQSNTVIPPSGNNIVVKLKVCKLCRTRKAFTTNMAYERHMRLHERLKKMQVPCNICQKVFPSMKCLEFHNNQKHKGNSNTNSTPISSISGRSELEPGSASNKNKSFEGSHSDGLKSTTVSSLADRVKLRRTRTHLRPTLDKNDRVVLRNSAKRLRKRKSCNKITRKVKVKHQKVDAYVTEVSDLPQANQSSNPRSGHDVTAAHSSPETENPPPAQGTLIPAYYRGVAVGAPLVSPSNPTSSRISHVAAALQKKISEARAPVQENDKHEEGDGRSSEVSQETVNNQTLMNNISNSDESEERDSVEVDLDENGSSGEKDNSQPMSRAPRATMKDGVIVYTKYVSDSNFQQLNPQEKSNGVNANEDLRPTDTQRNASGNEEGEPEEIDLTVDDDEPDIKPNLNFEEEIDVVNVAPERRRSSSPIIVITLD